MKRYRLLCGRAAYERPFKRRECDPDHCPVDFMSDPKMPAIHCYYMDVTP